MHCPVCQHQNPAEATFCGECGRRLESLCLICKTPNPQTNKFCHKCGGALTAGPSEARFASPESYTPKHLAEKILTSKSALEGERKLVTVLFADLKGSTELLADRDAEEARKILDPVLERMMEAVHRYEGTVNQVMGDGIMALFGAPVAHEDHAVRACYAALRMQESVKRYSEQLFRGQGATVQIRVGLNSGEVVVRAIGNDLRMDYTAVGQTTHLAARMEQLASPGSTLLTADTLALVEGWVTVTPRGPVPVKGFPEPLEVYELTGAGLARTRLQAAALRGLTRFVGRDAEIDHLRRVLERAGAGHGQIVAIVGEAGVGKSRLVYEFTHSHRVRDWLVLEAASVSYGKASSYLPVIDLLKGYFKISDRDGHREMRDKVLGRVLGLDRTLEPLLPPLLALLDVPVADLAWQNLDPPQRRQRTFEAVKRLLVRESQLQPLLVVFEDLHWIDGETQALLDSLADTLGSARLLLLVNYRPEYEHRWGSKTYYSQLRLDTLPAERTTELLEALLGADAGLEPLKQTLVRRGNPFFLEETVRTLVETGALAGERGAYRLARPVEALQVPATVQAILAARIDRLPPEEKQLLQAGAVVGKDVPYALLAAIADRPDEALRQELAHLQEAEFLYETRLFPELEYTFKHALTHEVAYGSLLLERRRALHARTVDAIERLYPDRVAEWVDQLAHHAVRGEVWDRAVPYLHQAARKAIAGSAYREAAASLERALVALARLPRRPETVEWAIDVRVELRHALFPFMEFEKILDPLREAERLADGLGDRRRLGLVSSLLANCYLLTGHPEAAMASGERGLALAEQLADLDFSVCARFYLGQVCYTRGDYQRGIELQTWIVESLHGDLVHARFGLAAPAPILSRTWLIWCLAETGAFSEAGKRYEECARLTERAEQPFAVTVAALGAGYLHLSKGEVQHAIGSLQRGLELCRTWNFLLPLTVVAAQLGYAYTLAGRVAEGTALLEEAIATRSARGTSLTQIPDRVWLGEAYHLAGRRAEAIESADRALRLAHEHGLRGHEAWALRLLGEVAAVHEPTNVGAAEAHYGEALALAAELGMLPLVAHCHLGLGKLYRRAGQSEQAHEQLTTATAKYREMGMGFWLEEAQEQLKDLE